MCAHAVRIGMRYERIVKGEGINFVSLIVGLCCVVKFIYIDIYRYTRTRARENSIVDYSKRVRFINPKLLYMYIYIERFSLCADRAEREAAIPPLCKLRSVNCAPRRALKKRESRIASLSSPNLSSNVAHFFRDFAINDTNDITAAYAIK